MPSICPNNSFDFVSINVDVTSSLPIASIWKGCGVSFALTLDEKKALVKVVLYTLNQTCPYGCNTCIYSLSRWPIDASKLFGKMRECRVDVIISEHLNCCLSDFCLIFLDLSSPKAQHISLEIEQELAWARAWARACWLLLYCYMRITICLSLCMCLLLCLFKLNETYLTLHLSIHYDS